MSATAAHAPAPAPRPSARRSSSPTSRVAPSYKPTAGAGGGLSGPAIKLSIAVAGKDPRFQRAIDKLKLSADKARSHPPAARKAQEAQGAALPPPNEKLAGAQANKVDDMGAAPTGKPESTSFLAMLRAEIQKVMPKKTEDAKDFMKGEDKQQLKGAMTGNVNAQKQEATAGIESASSAPPDTSAVEGKPVTPMPADAVPQAPAIGAAEAMPDRKPDAEVSLEKGKQDTGKLMTDNQLSTGQMEKANDSRFSAVVKTKSEADTFADTGPQKYRTDEQKIQEQSAAAAKGDEKKGLAGFLAQAGKGQKQVKERQLSTKEKDELARKKVADDIQAIFDRTKASVDKKLESLDKEVEAIFDEGADAAVAKMKDYVETRFDDRYSGISGKALWLKDKFIPLPGAVKKWFDEAHVVFLSELDRVVVRVANHVERRLKEAKDEIANGQKEIRSYVNGLPDNLKSVGLAAEKEVQSRFDELRQGVEDKKNDLAQKLAQKYKDASEKGAKALQELKDAHKSLYEKVRDAILAVIKILRDFKNRVLALLAKAAKAVDIIVSDPIGFLKNVLAAIKQGLAQFVDNIWTHLKAGFMAWLFGSLGDAGIEVPNDLSLGSILKLVLQILGITYARIREKAVKLLGERAVALIEQVATFIKVLITEGPEKLWEMMKEYLSNLKEMIIDAIQDWIITTVIKAAVTKLVSMFNPVGAIIQAILTIYNVVMFLIERINQILAFVESVVNSVYEIATGQIGSAANWIEKALARTIPIIIAFLARLLGITGITEKIVGIIKKIQSKVDEAIDKVITKVASGLKKLVGAGKAAAAKVASMVFPKKKLKAGTETHTMEVEEEASGYEVFVNSNRMRISEIITRGTNKGVPVTALEAAYKAWRAIPKPADPAADKANYTKRSEAYEKVFVAAQDVVEKIFTGEEVTKIEWYGLDSEGRAKGLKADPVTKKGPKGSQPRENIMGWDQGLQYDGKKVAYIKTHLLHHELSGPGRSFNLTPTSDAYNKKIFHAVEKESLKAVSKGDALTYVVNVVYENPTQAQLNKVTPVSKQKLLKYVAKRVNLTVTNKKDNKRLAYVHGENNYD